MLHILEPGLFTLIVDGGRPACRALGVPVGGAADRRSLALGNALVGNPPGAAALEVSLAGPRLRADVSLACVLHGAPFRIEGNQHPDGLQPGTTFTLQPGETLSIGGTTRGMRAYLCVRGGLREPRIMGSRSSLGPVRSGQSLACEPGEIRPRYLPPDRSVDEEVATLRVVTGPQAEWFEAADVSAQEFVVTPASNRMGLRLRGPAFTFRGVAREMVSEPVAPGAVQVTRDGQCIVLGVDGQTIGGYPKVAHVIAADLDRLGQIRPGQRVRFVEVALEVATRLYRERQRETDEWITRLGI